MDREVVLPEDPHETAERDRIDAVRDARVRDLRHTRGKPESELEDLHAEQARADVMAELMDGDDRGERHEEKDEGAEIHQRSAVTERPTFSARSAPRTSASM